MTDDAMMHPLFNKLVVSQEEEEEEEDPDASYPDRPLRR